MWELTSTGSGCRLTQRIGVRGMVAALFARVAGRPSAGGLALDVVRLYRLAGGGVTEAGLRVVIAGGSGFLGQHLAADLTCRGQEVILLTRSPNPASPFEQRVWDGRTVGAWTEVHCCGWVRSPCVPTRRWH